MQLESDLAEGWASMGGIATDRGQVEEAERRLRRAVELNPSLAQAHLMLSTALKELGRRQESREHATRALQLDPLSALVNNSVGYIYDEVGRPKEAAARYRRAIEIDPRSPDAYLYLGFLNAYTWNRFAEAVPLIERSIELDTGNPSAVGVLAFVLLDMDEVVKSAGLSLVRDPLEPFTCWNLGDSYYRSGRFADAEATFRKLLGLQPDFPWTRNYLGKTLLAQGKPDAALAAAQQNTDEGERVLLLPVFLQAAGRKAEADEALKAQIAHWGDTGAWYVAQTYAYRGEHDLAFEWLERAYTQKDAALVEIVGEHLMKGIADDPRFKAFLRKMKLPEWPSATLAAGTRPIRRHSNPKTVCGPDSGAGSWCSGPSHMRPGQGACCKVSRTCATPASRRRAGRGFPILRFPGFQSAALPLP